MSKTTDVASPPRSEPRTGVATARVEADTRPFILHPAYGLVGPVGVGRIEIIGYDAEAGYYRTYFFDSQGNVSTHTLKKRGDSWLWEGAHARCNGVFSDGGRTLAAQHERSDDGVNWEPSMTVMLRRAD